MGDALMARTFEGAACGLGKRRLFLQGGIVGRGQLASLSHHRAGCQV